MSKTPKFESMTQRARNKKFRKVSREYVRGETGKYYLNKIKSLKRLRNILIESLAFSVLMLLISLVANYLQYTDQI
jgi:hypothetical protein